MTEKNTYIKNIQKHYEEYFGISGTKLIWDENSKSKIHQDFHVLEFKPNKRHNFWAYCSIGMSLHCIKDNQIELFIYSPKKNKSLVEIITACAFYHNKYDKLNLHHTVNLGMPWLKKSICKYGFISLPYLDGKDLEIFEYNGTTTSCYWLIPITEKEKDYKIQHGADALEILFEEKKFDYLNPKRKCLINTSS